MAVQKINKLSLHPYELQAHRATARAPHTCTPYVYSKGRQLQNLNPNACEYQTFIINYVGAQRCLWINNTFPSFSEVLFVIVWWSNIVRANDILKSCSVVVELVYTLTEVNQSMFLFKFKPNIYSNTSTAWNCM